VTGATGFQFLHPLWLLLLPPLWILLTICVPKIRHTSIWQRCCDRHLLARMTTGQNAGGGHKLALWVVGGVLTLGVVALAAPSWSWVTQPMLEATSARVIVLDLSRSMLVRDLRPDRFEHAVVAANELLGSEFDGETGLVVFSASAFVLAPLSRDADTLRAFVEVMHPDTMPIDGFNLAQAIDTAQALLASSFGGRGDILVLSAGDSHDEAAIGAATQAALQGHRVSILAIGSQAGGPVLDRNGGLLRNNDGNIQISKTNFALLQRIADAGNGALSIAVTDIANDDLLMSRLGASGLVESARSNDKSDGEAADDGVWLVWLMLPMALMLFRKNMISVLLLLILLPAEQEVFAAESATLWKHAEHIAFDAYQRQDYETASKLATDSLLRGASLYRRGQFEQALQQFDNESSAASMYNRGNSLVQLQRYAEAIRAYQQALVADPDLQVARYNKRLLELYLQQQGEVSADLNGEAGDANNASNAEDGLETRIGIADDLEGNPADDANLGPGSGAAQEAGQVDPLERFDGEDFAQERFVLRALGAEQELQTEFIERWIVSLPETSTELYKRKFLRDYRRQKGQPE